MLKCYWRIKNNIRRPTKWRDCLVKKSVAAPALKIAAFGEESEFSRIV